MVPCWFIDRIQLWRKSPVADRQFGICPTCVAYSQQDQGLGKGFLELRMKSTYSNDIFQYLHYWSNENTHMSLVLWVKFIKKMPAANVLILPAHRGRNFRFGRKTCRMATCEKASWIKALPAVFIFHPFFVPTGYGTQRLASLTKMPPALLGVQDTLLCRAL